jgi:hypothetical protein
MWLRSGGWRSWAIVACELAVEEEGNNYRDGKGDPYSPGEAGAEARAGVRWRSSSDRRGPVFSAVRWMRRG